MSEQAALADLTRIAKELEAQYPDLNRAQGATVAPLSEIIVGDVKPVLWLIMKEAGALALAGIVIGTGCAILATSLMRKLLFGTPPWDITTLVCVAAVLGASALLASFLPARRAASVDPISALRTE